MTLLTSIDPSFSSASHGLTPQEDIRASLKEAIGRETAGLEALDKALDGALGDAFEKAVRLLYAAKGRVIVTGMGKSGHIARKLAATFASTGTQAHFLHPAEASHGDLGMIGDEDVVIAISWSGEAPELADIVAFTRRFRVPLIALTSRVESALGKACDIALILPSMPEACPNGLAPTTSTTMQLAAGDAIAVALLSLKGFSAQDFRRFHPGGKLGSRLRKVHDLMHAGIDVPIVPADATLSEALFEMTRKRFGVTAILDDAGKFVGVLSDGDVRRAFGKAFADGSVKEAMSGSPRTIGADALADEALGVMNAAVITSLFVVDDEGQLVGIIHIHDLLRAGVA